MFCVLLIALGVGIRSSDAQTTRPALLAAINRARLQNGLTPLADSVPMSRAAQRHADDMARRGNAGLIGSDGSDSNRRALESGVRDWPGRRLFVTELTYFGSNPDQAVIFWLNDPALRRVLLNPKARESGSAGAGGATSYFSLLVGAQPNVLPVFIEDGAASTATADVSLRLSQEEYLNEPDGPALGRAVEMRIGTSQNLDDLPWRRYESFVPITLPAGAGSKRVYVQLRDASGRTVLSSASVVLDAAAPIPTPSGLGVQPSSDATAVAEPTEPPPPPAATGAPIAAGLLQVATLAPINPTEPTSTPFIIIATPPPQFVPPTRALLPTPRPLEIVPPAPPFVAWGERIAGAALPWLCLGQSILIFIMLRRLLRARH